MDSNLSSELDSFHQFIGEKLANGSTRPSPEEALDEWRAANPSSQERAESVAAIKRALADMESGDTGRPAEEIIANLRHTYNVPSEQ